MRVLWRLSDASEMNKGRSFKLVSARSAVKSGRGLPQSKTLRETRGRNGIPEVLVCASPLALSSRVKMNEYSSRKRKSSSASYLICILNDVPGP
jgi:hypothetical protein